MLLALLPRRLQQQPPPEDDIYDIVVLAPKESILPILLIGFGILFLLLLAGLALWWKFGRNGSEAPPSPRSKMHHRLRHLELRESTMEPNRFAQELSDSLKDYLAERYGEPVRYETAQEFLRRSSEPGATFLPEAASEELRQFLNVAEEVKFGNTTHAASLTGSLLHRAKTVVELCDVINDVQATQPGGRA